MNRRTHAAPVTTARSAGPGPQYQAANAIAGHSKRYGALLCSTPPRLQRKTSAIATASKANPYLSKGVCCRACMRRRLAADAVAAGGRGAGAEIIASAV